MIKHRLTWEYLLGPLIGVPLGLCIVYFYWLWMAPIPIEVFDRHLEPKYVRAGDTVTLHWTEVRSASCRSIIYRKLVAADGKVIEFEPVFSNRRPVGYNANTFSFVMPSFAATGRVTYRVRSQFICNWAQEFLGGPWLPLQDLHIEYIARRETR